VKKYRALEVAKGELDKYYEGIQRASVIWEATQALGEVSTASGLLSEEDATNRIQSDEAIKAVGESMARSFSELDHMLNTEVQHDTSQDLASAPVPKPMGYVQEVQPAQSSPQALSYQPGQPLFGSAKSKTSSGVPR
jgi:hypothetical protein